VLLPLHIITATVGTASGPWVGGIPEHHKAQPQQPAPDLTGQPTALPDSVEVAQQMSPAHLPVRGVDERIAGVVIRGHHRGALLAAEVQDHIPRPGRVDGEHRQQRLHRRPHPVADRGEPGWPRASGRASVGAAPGRMVRLRRTASGIASIHSPPRESGSPD
jgi:hypothetical protein